MFLGGFPKRPEKAAAYRQLRHHLSIMSACIACIRAAPYLLHFLSRDKDDELLKLEF